MAKRRQPRDGRGRFTATGIPFWFGALAVFVVVVSVLR